MLTLTLRPGEYVDIGNDIRFIFTGGTANNIHVLVDAPKDRKVFRSEAPPEVMGSAKTQKQPLQASRKEKPEEDLETRIMRMLDSMETY